MFHCCQRLPNLTISLWEQSLAGKKNLPTWNDLDAFLRTRITTLEAIAETRGLSKSGSSANTSNSFKIHLSHQTPPKSKASETSKTCPLCPREKHGIRGCKKFRNMSIQERWECVRRHKLCSNCLSNAQHFNDCSSTFNCVTCRYFVMR